MKKEAPNVDCLFAEVQQLTAIDCSVSETEKGSPLLVAESEKGIVRIECDSAGGVLCIAAIGDNLRRAKYYQMDGLPDGFIREALHDLTVEREQSATWTQQFATKNVYGGTFIHREALTRLLQTLQELNVSPMLSTHPKTVQFPWIDWTQQTSMPLPWRGMKELREGQVLLASTGGLSLKQEKPAYMEEQ